MTYKTWIKTFFTVFLSLTGIVLLLNITADPLLLLPFVHKWNNRVRFINERQQKTNQLYFSHFYGKSRYDGIILGSSRSSALSGHLFAPHYNVYNYAAAASRPDEAISYLSFAQELLGKDLNVVIIGLDFMGTGFKSKSRVKGGTPVIYTQEIKKPLYTLANLLNLKSAHLATRILRANLNPKKESYYERKTNTIVEYFRPTSEEQNAAFNETLNIYREAFRNYKYSDFYKDELLDIKKAFPRTRFIVFTTPVAAPHWELIEEFGLLPQYKQWLKESVEVFGEVWHFMDKNEVTENWQLYFSDSHHLYPKEADLITRRLLGEEKGLPKGFGKKLTAQNLDSYLKNFK